MGVLKNTSTDLHQNWPLMKLFETSDIRIINHYRSYLLGSPTLVGCLKLYCWVFVFFLPDHGSQQSRRGWLANVYKSSVIGVANPDISFIPPLIFTGGQKVRFLALLLNNAWVWATVVWKPSKISSPFLNLGCSDDLAMSPPNLVHIGPRVFRPPWQYWSTPWKRTKNLSLIVNNSAPEWPIWLKFGI